MFKLVENNNIAILIVTIKHNHCRGIGTQIQVSIQVYIQVSLSGGRISDGTLYTGWRHQMETFSALLAICAGNVPGEFPAQRPVTRSFDVFFDQRLYKRLSKQSWGWWFETLSRPLWRHCNENQKDPHIRPPFKIMMGR